MARRLDHSKLPSPPTSEEPSFEVGYGKPPVHTRFQPGRSGNPRGRPRGSKNKSTDQERMNSIAMEEAYRSITVRDGNRQVKMPMMQAVIRSLSLKAASGNSRAQKMFVDLIKSVERKNKAEHDKVLETVIEYKFDWEKELERRAQTGETGPEPTPHPDDIDIDLSAGTYEFRGPLTIEQKRLWDWVQLMDEQCEETIAELEKKATKRPNDQNIEEELTREREFHAKIRKILEARSDWRRHGSIELPRL